MDTTVSPAGRYSSYPQVALADRAWPGRTLTTAPRWLSTDLRDGNQSLVAPMRPDRKLAMFDLLVGMGYREIEVGFPVASQDDHDFVRLLVEQDRIPDDVRISVLVPARPELIAATVRSLRGVPRATIHLYHGTAPLLRQLVYRMTREQCRDLAVRGAEAVLRETERVLPLCDIGFQYSTEMFNETELDLTVELCEAVMDVWQVGADRPVVLNFPTTVERTTPNVFADQIEYLDRTLTRRQHVCLSVHPHNDRGTGVASAELAQLAGAERVEGCLFGNGERAGNVCLVTLGLNLLSQGIDPGVDFSDLPGVRRTVEECTGLPVPARHPYGGDLVYTAFSGAHQDAIRKGFDEQRRVAARTGLPVRELPWRMPYLPLDPGDIGRTYETLVRLNSQSGKGGTAYVLADRYGLHLPGDLQVEFARMVQRHADAHGGEVTAEQLFALFHDEYLSPPCPTTPLPRVGAVVVDTLYLDGLGFDIDGRRAAATARIVTTLAGWGIDVLTVQHTGAGSRGGQVAGYAECRVGDRTVWGVGIDDTPQVAAFAAVRAAVGRATSAANRSTPGSPVHHAGLPTSSPADHEAGRIPSVHRRGEGAEPWNWLSATTR